MPLTPQPLPLQFASGVDTKTDSKQVPTAKLLTLENAVFVKRTSLSKRNGYASLPRMISGDLAEYSNAVGLASRQDELLVFADERAYSYRTSAERWVNTGEVLSTVATEQPIARTGTDQDTPDHATNNGVTVVAWADSRGGVYCSVLEAETGRILLPDVSLDANGVQPQCCAVGEVLHVYWRDSTGHIWVAVVNPVTPLETPSPFLLLDTLSQTNPRFDVVDCGQLQPSLKPSVMVWAVDGGGFRVSYVHPSGVLGSPATGLPSGAFWSDTITGPIAVAVDRHAGDQIAIAYGATDVSIRWVDPTSLLTSNGLVVAAATVTATRLAVEIVDGPLAWWACETAGSTVDQNTVRSGCVDTSTATVSSSGRVLRGHRLASRAFFDGSSVYALVGHEVFYFPYLALVRLSADDLGGSLRTQSFYRSVVGQWPGQDANVQIASVQPVEPDASGLSRDHAVTITYRIQVESENGTEFSETGIKLVTLEMDNELAYQSAELGRGLYLASSCQQHYDGLRWAEAGFHTAPDTANAATMAAEGAAGAMDAGVYLYRIIYEEIDAQGELHPSSPSAPQSATISASKKINLTIPTYRLTNKQRVRIGVFRSEANAEGTIDTIAFYRVSSLDPTSTGDNGFLANDATADTVSFVDNMTDAVLTTREPLYTNGGILADDPSPMRGDVIAGGKSRLFWSDSTEPNTIRYSQEKADERGVEMPVALKLQTDPYGGRVVALGVMDGAVYGFCETAIYGFGGPGPLAAPDAGADSFSKPELVTADCGCKSPNSICQSPVGIFFQSEKGIKLLTRERQVVDVGADVYTYNDQLVTRATLLPDRSQVLFLVQSGLSLLYDYERQAWSTFTNHEGLDARVVDGRYYYLRTDGRVFVETPGEYRDDNSHIVMKIETAWIKMAGYLQGWQRILWAYFLGEWKSAHTLVIRYRIDYNPGYFTPVELDVNSNIDPRYYGEGEYGAGTYGNGTADSTRYQRAIHYNLPCQAIQFRIEDKEATEDFGASFELSELLLIGGVLDTRAKIGPARIQ